MRDGRDNSPLIEPDFKDESTVIDMNSVTKVEPLNVVPLVSANPMAIIEMAIAKGAPVETLERLMALQERYEANEAKKEFALAMASAKSEIRPIVKAKAVDFTSAKGRTNYQYEDLAGIADAVDPILAKHGLSYRFRSAQNEGNISVTCILGHERGHTEETTLTAYRDESGNKNPIQAVGSTVTYLQRYTLKLALGLAATKDTDGVPPEEPSKTIDEAQFRYLQDLIEKAVADESKMLAFCKVSKIEDMTQANYKWAEGLLRKMIADKKPAAPKTEAK